VFLQLPAFTFCTASATVDGSGAAKPNILAHRIATGFRVQKLRQSFLAPLTRCATEPEREIFRRTRLCLLDVAPSRPVLISI
jgi:hypothetical protein